MSKRRRCEIVRADGFRCNHAGWVSRDGHLVCGTHRYTPSPRYVEKPGKLEPCSGSPPTTATPPAEPDS